MRVSLIFAVISLALIAQAQETTTVPTPNNGQLSPMHVTSTDEIIRLASQQRGNLSSTIFQFSPQSILKTDTFLSTQVVSDAVASFKKEQSQKSLVKEFNVSPNPASDFVRIEAAKNGRFELYNSVGQMVLSYNWKRNDNLPLPVSQLPSGIYNYQFVTGDGEVSNGKLVKD